MAQKTYRKRLVAATIPLISVLFAGAALSPSFVRASILADILATLTKTPQDNELGSFSVTGNLQTMPLLRPAMNLTPALPRGGGEVTIIDRSAVVAAEGPSGTIADIEKPKNATISRYIVREGDSLSSIAKMFGVSGNTISWANDLARDSKLKVGQQLTILPVTGVKYTVKQGDTLTSIAKRFGADAAEIGSFNGTDDSLLASGDEIVIPDGEIAQPAPSKPRLSNPAHDVGPVGTLAEVGYYIAPLSIYIKTQGVHGYNGVDLAAPVGTPLVASASGEVIIAKQGGWNGGYGSYVVISHPNGSQTLYGHMSNVYVYDGQEVVQGQVIGTLGKSGKATGPHVHFEIRNGIRNPF